MVSKEMKQGKKKSIIFLRYKDLNLLPDVAHTINGRAGLC